MKSLLILGTAVVLSSALNVANAQQTGTGSTASGAASTDVTEVIITGTRRLDRTVTESSAPIDVLTGFMNPEGNAYGRPVGVAMDRRGALLVADDVGNVVWHVAGSPVR